MLKRSLLLIGLACLLTQTALGAKLETEPTQQWPAEVAAAECSFAASMAKRDFALFGNHLSEQALFFGSGPVLRGKDAVLAQWRAYFDGPRAPFSWSPDEVVVSPDGSIAHSTGLVRDPQGGPMLRFNSVWRQESPGVWRVVVDRASPLTPAERSLGGKATPEPCSTSAITGG